MAVIQLQGINTRAGLTFGAAAPKADPTQLPAATSPGQTRDGSFTYGRSLDAGQTYVDPLSDVTVLKLTDDSYPTANSNAMKGYATSGPRISQPWTSGGNTFYTIALAAPNGLIDLRYDTLVSSNYRDPGFTCDEVDIAFSLNSSTPRYCFVFESGNILRKFDTETGNEVTGGGFPKTITSQTDIRWIQTQLDDTWIAFMNNSTHTYLGYRSSDNTVRTMNQARSGLSHDELHLDLLDPIIYMSVDSDVNANAPWNLDSDTFDTTPTGQTANGPMSDDHASPGKGFVVGTAHFAAGGGCFRYRGSLDDIDHIITTTNGYHPGNEFYTNAHWCTALRGAGSIDDMWHVASNENDDNGSSKIREKMLGIVKMDGSDVRILGSTDQSNSTVYDHLTKPSLSPDGKLVTWTSDMNSSGGRTDVFVAKMPVS